MQQRLTLYDLDYTPLDKGDPDYPDKLLAWSQASEKAADQVWGALCEILYAAQEAAIARCSQGDGCRRDCAILDAAIDRVLDAMPPHAKAHFDALMGPPCAS
jgi:hypothetical protein